MIKLLLVDESPLLRRTLARDHDKTKFELVATARDGMEAILHFEEHRPQVVTMDITMPHLDGIACVEHLVSIDPEVMILVISALNDKSTGIEALEKGAMGFINKPFTEQDIISALEILIED